AKPSTSMTSATGSWNGRVSSLAARGRITTRQSLGRSALSHRPSVCQRCTVITRRCGTCTSLSPPRSTTYSRPWQNWRIVSTTLGADRACSPHKMREQANLYRFRADTRGHSSRYPGDTRGDTRGYPGTFLNLCSKRRTQLETGTLPIVFDDYSA